MMDRFLMAMLVAVFVVLASKTTNGSGANQKMESLSKRSEMTQLPIRMASLFERTKAVCFGRFVVDVPATAIVIYGPAEVDVPIAFYRGEGDRIAKHIADYLIDVEKDREFLFDDVPASLPLFGKVIDGTAPGQKLVFGSRSHINYSIDSFIPVQGHLFVHHITRVQSTEQEVERLINILNRVASHLRLRDTDEIPEAPGVCIDGGFVPLDFLRERATIGVRFKEFPDVHFSVDVHKNLDRLLESEGLEVLIRQTKEEAFREGRGAEYDRIKFLRLGSRQLGDWNGYESLAHTASITGAVGTQEFRFQSLGAVNAALQPRLDVRLDTGVKNDRKFSARPSISDEEAVALWDKLIGSIRVRLPSDAKPKSHGSPRVPLGELTPTGGTCRQTGWWQCAESGSIDKDKRHYFTVGEVLPEAIFFDGMTLWNKLTGNRPTSSQVTLWRLVGYGDGQMPSESA